MPSFIHQLIRKPVPTFRVDGIYDDIRRSLPTLPTPIRNFALFEAMARDGILLSKTAVDPDIPATRLRAKQANDAMQNAVAVINEILGRKR